METEELAKEIQEDNLMESSCIGHCLFTNAKGNCDYCGLAC